MDGNRHSSGSGNSADEDTSSEGEDYGRNSWDTRVQAYIDTSPDKHGRDDRLGRGYHRHGLRADPYSTQPRRTTWNNNRTPAVTTGAYLQSYTHSHTSGGQGGADTKTRAAAARGKHKANADTYDHRSGEYHRHGSTGSGTKAKGDAAGERAMAKAGGGKDNRDTSRQRSG
jgi:hypothetical protein